MSLYRDEAVVLRTWKLGEADRILSLHTRDSGKVRCVARGVRRTRSKFGARLDPAGHVAVQLYRGRGDLDTVTQVETISSFTRLRSDPSRFVRASAMLEAVEHISPDREPDHDRHVMLARALATLDRDGGPLVLAGFFLKLLSHEGVRPVLGNCVACGVDRSLVAIDLQDGGVKCRDCARGRRLSPAALHLLRLVLGGGLAAALRHPTDAVAAEVVTLAGEAMELHLERRLRSLRVLGGG